MNAVKFGKNEAMAAVAIIAGIYLGVKYVKPIIKGAL